MGLPRDVLEPGLLRVFLAGGSSPLGRNRASELQGLVKQPNQAYGFLQQLIENQERQKEVEAELQTQQQQYV
ncbi:unnamed protein product [Caretta caretta]